MLGEEIRIKLDGSLKTPDDVEKDELTPERQAQFFIALENRLSKRPDNYLRPKGVEFAQVKAALEANPKLILSLIRMEETGGNPDIIDVESGAFVFGDCSIKSPTGRRDLTYEQAAEMAKKFGIEMMTEAVYKKIQQTGELDSNTWSWLYTPNDLRKFGAANLASRYDDEVKIRPYDADSHRQAVGWRGMLRVRID